MSEEATTTATPAAEGAAPQRTGIFNQMAQQLDAAMKGVELPTTPAKPPETPQPPTAPAPAEPPKPAEKPPEPPQPAEPPKPEPAPTEDELLENPYSRDWKTIRQHLKERRELKAEMEKAKTERETLLKELQEAKAKPPPPVEPARTPAELDELKKTLEAEKEAKSKLEHELKIIALERTPEFRTHYQQRFESAIAAAKSAVPVEDQAKVQTIMDLPPSEYRKSLLNTLLEPLSIADQTAVSVALLDMDRARAERDSKLKDNEAEYKKKLELDAVKAAEEQKAQTARQEMAIKGVLEAARKTFDAFKTLDGNDAHNTRVKTAEERVTRFFKGQMDPQEVALLPVLASDYEVVRSERDSLKSELDQARKTIAAYESSNPQITAGSKKTETKAKGFIEKFKEAYPG